MHCDRVVLFFVDFMDVIQFKPCIESLYIDFNDSVLGGPPPPERAANLRDIAKFSSRTSPALVCLKCYKESLSTTDTNSYLGVTF